MAVEGAPATQSGRRRRVVYGSTLSAGVLLMVALLVIVNYLAFRHYERFDWTRSGLYTLSDKTKQVLSHLDVDIEAVMFMDPGAEIYPPTKELLARYAAASAHLKVREVDPLKNLAEAQQLVQKYDIQRDNVVVFVGPGDRRVVEGADLADYDYSGSQYGEAPKLQGFKGEQLFTSAIVELVEQRKPKILFTSGHGEARLDDSVDPRGLGRAQDFLGRDNFELEEWSSLGADRVPEGTDLVVIAGPTSGFTAPELEALSRFLTSGGRVLALVDPTLTETSQLADVGLRSWLGEYGVDLGDDIVVDPSNLLPFFSAETIFADHYGSHAITDALQQARIPVVFALARSVSRGADVPAGETVTDLAKTSADGWGETRLDRLDQVEKDDQDREGPISLGVAVQLGSPEGEAGSEGGDAEAASAPGPDETATTEAADPPDEGANASEEPEAVAPEGQTAAQPEKAEESPGRMVVFGDSDFMTNGQLGQAGNATLVANTMNWLVERKSHLGIGPKTPEQVRLSLTRAQLRSIQLLVLLLLPGLGVVAGTVIYFRRRR
jgi:ABC-type uncharacterized transport system involved in gliding motility auxiliary subunit